MTDKEKLQVEKDETDILLNEGIKYKAGLFRFHVKPLMYGTMLQANRFAMQLKVNLNLEDNTAILRELSMNAKPMIDFLAVCTLRSYWKIFLFRRVLSKYLFWKMNPRNVPVLILMIFQMYDLVNFMNSIRLISHMTVTSPMKPNPIEKNGSLQA